MFTTLKPAAGRLWLLGLGGVVWSGVGIVLCRLAFVWLVPVRRPLALALGLSGVCLGLAVYRFGFVKIAKKNIDRVCRFADKRCIFAFQAWRSYVIVVVMMTLGITMRHSSIPKPLLAVVYSTIGGALFLSSLHYYRTLVRIGRSARK